MNETVGAAGVTTKSQLENYYRWVEPDSDITVCLKFETADRLQMEVLRGIDAGSNTGKEVGGILLGRTELDEGRTLAFVDDFETVPCEHRQGPSYALTGKEALNFEAALARVSARQTTSVVGYYRSHNRQGLFLSPDDMRLIQRHFRRPDNLFLLVKTLPGRACTAGFFFWKDGRIQSEFTDSEAPLIPIALSSPGGSSLLGGAVNLEDSVDDLPAASPVITSPEPEPRRDGHRRLIRGLAVTGIAAGVTLAVVLYREMGPAQPQTSDAPQPVTVAGSEPAAPTRVPDRVPARVPAVEQSGPVPKPAETVLRQARNAPATPLRDEPRAPAPAPTVAPAAARNSAPNQEAPVPSSKPLTAAAERPLNTSPTILAGIPAGTPAAPPAPIREGQGPTGPAAEKPVTLPSPTEAVVPRATTPAPPTDTGAAAAPDVTPAPPPASAAGHTFVGPQVIHQVTPAVPRGVGSMITTDVQLDVAVAIDANGKVTGARVASTKGAAAGLLTIEALKAAQLFRFQPARENGRNVASSMVLTFRFARTSK